MIRRGEPCEDYVDVGVVEELGGDVGAAFFLGRRGQVGVTVPLPAGAVGVAGRWGGMLHPGGRHNADRLACKFSLGHVSAFKVVA